MKTIVVSAVNINTGGTLTILRDCLDYLSRFGESGEYRVIALVHKKEQTEYDNVEYIEIPWSKKRWIYRVWCEYVYMRWISKKLAPIHLWLSLHDTTPNVCADRRAVYCHNPFPFYKWRWRELLMNYKIVLFSWFSYYIYRINIHRNNKIIVQQQWIKEAFKNMFCLASNNIVVAPPERKRISSYPNANRDEVYTFLYPSSPNLHKNFEVLCEASKLLEAEVGKGVFKVLLTLNKKDNKYASWLNKKWGDIDSIQFAGFMSKEQLYGHYVAADCFVFSSMVETWGLPITEFMETSPDKPMLLADLPYAHETASGASKVYFFNPSDPMELKNRMKDLLHNNHSAFHPVQKQDIEEPRADSWKELFAILLK